MSGSDLRAGGRSKTSGLGGSVAKARAANVSMMRLTHRSWMAVRTDTGDFDGVSVAVTKAVMMAITTAEILTLNWNCRNFLTES